MYIQSGKNKKNVDVISIVRRERKVKRREQYKNSKLFIKIKIEYKLDHNLKMKFVLYNSQQIHCMLVLITRQ